MGYLKGKVHLWFMTDIPNYRANGIKLFGFEVVVITKYSLCFYDDSDLPNRIMKVCFVG